MVDDYVSNYQVNSTTMTKKTYTKQQILEAIKHWKFVLKTMNESKSLVLDAFAEKFGTNVVFSHKPFAMNDNTANSIFGIFNEHMFGNKLKPISIKCLQYQDICKSAKQIYDKYKHPNDGEYIFPPSTIYGMYFIVVLNDKIVKYSDSLVFSDEEIIFFEYV